MLTFLNKKSDSYVASVQKEKCKIHIEDLHGRLYDKEIKCRDIARGIYYKKQELIKLIWKLIQCLGLS